MRSKGRMLVPVIPGTIAFQSDSLYDGGPCGVLMIDWRPISEVPYDCPLWLRVIDRTGERRLGFPCRWTATGWVNAVTNTSVTLHPTHWQPWPQRQFDRESEARIRAIQLLLGAELAELYDIFLQQPTPPEIARLLDRLADRELNQLSRDSPDI